MVLEYCDNGTLKQYLDSVRECFTAEISDKLARLAYGICLGMDYLASKEVSLFLYIYIFIYSVFHLTDGHCCSLSVMASKEVSLFLYIYIFIYSAFHLTYGHCCSLSVMVLVQQRNVRLTEFVTG